VPIFSCRISNQKDASASFFAAENVPKAQTEQVCAFGRGMGLKNEKELI